MMRPDPEPRALLAALPSRLHDAVFAQAARAASALAVSDSSGAWNFAELETAARSAASWLVTAGVRGGDRVVLITENCREAAALLLACSMTDAWAVMVNARASASEIEGFVESSSPRLICAVLASVQARAHAAHFSLLATEIEGLGRLAANAADHNVAAEPVHADAARQVAVLIYTSGSSGAPKGVMLTHRNLLYMAAVSGAIRGLGPADKMLGLLPISHSVGLSVVLLGALMHGASVNLLARFSPPIVLKAFAEGGVTVALGAPAMLSLLLDYAAQRGQTEILAPNLRIISVSGAPLEQDLKNRAEAFFQLPIHHGYGITECGPTIAQIRPGAERADCSVGPVLPGVDMRFLDRDGADMPLGQTGELVVRSPGVMLGYYRDPDRTREVLDGEGWFRTGDLARLDGDDLILEGRAKDLIIRFGFNVSPGEVEAVLAGHPAVLHAAVIGRPSAEGEEILAFVVPRTGFSIDLTSLAQHAAEHLASYKRPTRFFTLASLPVTPTGKILKHALLDEAEAKSRLVEAV